MFKFGTAKNNKKIKIKVTGMHCVSCAMSIDGALEDTEGVLKSKTNFAKGETEVEFKDNVDPNVLVKEITSLGYQAEVES